MVPLRGPTIATNGSRPVVLCLDSPGFGGSELSLMRVFSSLNRKPAAVVRPKELHRQLADFFTHNGVATVVNDSPNAFRFVLRGLRNARECLCSFPGASFLVWAHHCDSNRWLQLVLALAGRDFVIVERLVPASAEQGRFSRSRLSVPIKRFVAARARKVILNGHSQVEQYRKVFGLKKANLLAIPGSRPIERIAREVDRLRRERADLKQRLQLPPGPVLLCVARLVEQKDQATLIHALTRCRVNESPVPVLVLVGDGPERSTLQALAEAEAPGRVFFTGHQNDPIPWLAVADLFLLPSLSEGLPGALIEAMAAKLPCIATHIPGNSELVHDGETGLAVPVRSPAAVAAAVRRLLDEPDLAARLAQAGFEWVSTNYDEEREKSDWNALVEELAGCQRFPAVMYDRS